MGPDLKFLSKRIRARVESVRRHKSISFINATDPFLKQLIQLKALPGIDRIVGCRGSVFEAEVDQTNENLITKVLWSKHPVKVHIFFY